MTTLTREPWHIDAASTHHVLPCVYLKDTTGQIVATFKDHRDAQKVLDMFEKIEELNAELDELRLELEEAQFQT